MASEVVHFLSKTILSVNKHLVVSKQLLLPVLYVCSLWSQQLKCSLATLCFLDNGVKSCVAIVGPTTLSHPEVYESDLILNSLRYPLFFFFWGFSILQPWWTWGRSSTSTGNCKKPKPITSEHFIWNRMTPSPSPTCASCGTSWRNRAWGPRAPELRPVRLPTCHLHARPGGEDGLRAPRSLLSSGRDGRETQGGCLLREAVTVPLRPS